MHDTPSLETCSKQYCCPYPLVGAHLRAPQQLSIGGAGWLTHASRLAYYSVKKLHTAYVSVCAIAMLKAIAKAKKARARHFVQALLGCAIIATSLWQALDNHIWTLSVSHHSCLLCSCGSKMGAIIDCQTCNLCCAEFSGLAEWGGWQSVFGEHYHM